MGKFFGNLHLVLATGLVLAIVLIACFTGWTGEDPRSIRFSIASPVSVTRPPRCGCSWDRIDPQVPAAPEPYYNRALARARPRKGPCGGVAAVT